MVQAAPVAASIMLLISDAFDSTRDIRKGEDMYMHIYLCASIWYMCKCVCVYNMWNM